MQNSDVNGWENRQTWNVALWIRQTEPLYHKACDYVKMRRVQGKPITYKGFIAYANLKNGRRTPDGISWSGAKLDYPALDRMLIELVN